MTLFVIISPNITSDNVIGNVEPFCIEFKIENSISNNLPVYPRNGILVGEYNSHLYLLAEILVRLTT